MLHTWKQSILEQEGNGLSKHSCRQTVQHFICGRPTESFKPGGGPNINTPK